MNKFVTGYVHSNNKLCSNLFELKIEVCDIIKNYKVGQFASIYLGDKSKILPRPISISEFDENKGIVTFIIQIVGEGTKELSKLNKEDKVSMLMPLGTGYNLNVDGTVYLIGGGVGIPPLVQTYKELKNKKQNVKVILGFRDESFLIDKFDDEDLYICTESGKYGFKGNVVDFLKTINIPNNILCCGPYGMLKALAKYGKENNINTQISMEEHMACSVGVCLGCVINVMENSRKVSKKVCVDGPVFNGGVICFE